MLKKFGHLQNIFTTWNKFLYTVYIKKNCETFYLFIFIFTHNQLEINHSACRNKDCE